MAFTPKVATHCCVCGIGLIDGVSIEKGIGPVCRKKYRYEDAYPVSAEQVTELAMYLTLAVPQEVAGRVLEAAARNDSRKAVNLLIYYGSAEQGEAAIKAAHAVGILGYKDLAARIHERLVPVHISRTEDGLVKIQSPYSDVFLSAIRPIRGQMTFDRKEKAWLAPDTDEVFEVIAAAFTAAYAGEWALGTEGPFQL